METVLVKCSDYTNKDIKTSKAPKICNSIKHNEDYGHKENTLLYTDICQKKRKIEDIKITCEEDELTTTG